MNTATRIQKGGYHKRLHGQNIKSKPDPSKNIDYPHQ
jgi:hypothetical protein